MKTRHRNNLRRRLITLAFTPFIVFACLELFMRYQLSQIATASAATSAPSIPAAYVHSSFYTADFLAERDKFGDFKVDDNGFTWHTDFKGKYFNVVNGWRATTDQPENATHTIWMYGSSVVYSFNLPDNDTLPSSLQRQVGHRYRVENRGMNAIDIDKEYYLLTQTDVKPGDIVIMYDGLLDAIAPRRTAINRMRLEPSLCRAILPVMNWSVFVRVVCIAQEESAMPDATLANSTAQDYAKYILKSRTFVLQHGAAFYHFLQPSVYIDTLDYEHQFVTQAPIVARMWPLIAQAPYTIDLSKSLDELRRTEIVWIDDVHTNEQANAVIAAQIAARLVTAF